MNLFMIVVIPILMTLMCIYEVITLKYIKLFDNVALILIVLMAIIGVVLEVKTYI